MSFDISLSGLADTSALLDAVRMQWDDDTLYIAAPTVNYAVFQERGTSSIDARPFMRPAADRVGSNPKAMLARYGPQTPQAGPIETLAIAVQNEAKKIADAKGVRDSGTLINSITYEEA